MFRDIKKVIIGLCISLILFAIGVAIVITETYLKVPSEIIRLVIETSAVFSALTGFCLSIIFFVATIEFISIESSTKKAIAIKYRIQQERRKKLPQNVEFSVYITDKNNKMINGVLHKNIKCKAIANRKKVYISFYLPHNIELEMNIKDFNDNFTY